MKALPFLTVLATSLGVQAWAQQVPQEGDSGTITTVVQKAPPTTLKAVTVFLHRADSVWSASLTGNLKDPATERVEISLGNGSVTVLALPPQGRDRLCETKMKDRTKFVYQECNSAFYSAKLGSAVAGNLIRGIYSLGISIVTDAASGSTAYAVALNQQALDAAVAESNAVEFARESAPLLEYREVFSRAVTSERLRNFISTYEGTFDPESLVGQAKSRLPAVMRQEEVAEQQRAAEAARRALLEREAEAERQADLEALREFRANLRPGDHVRVMVNNTHPAYGIVVEMRPPLAYLQWDGFSSASQWVRLDNLLPPR